MLRFRARRHRSARVSGAVAELERSLIAERVRAGLRNAKAKGKTLGRPRVTVDAARIARLRAQGRSIRETAEELGYARSLVQRDKHSLPS